ncbi:neudesin-like [Pocillopora damicornis]|uniref:neudesin-like n=1 Tax=Pocillopora damicornis TaxID=46731 RepID=UPI000F550819|nr:neudesin-like [Pocillopora damicornis]
MEQIFLVQLLFLSSLIISLAAVDITLKNDDLIHSPFSEELGNDANLDGPKVFTKEELSVYDGTNPDLPIYVAIKGIVFDVSESKKAYGPGGSYNKFTGKDASRLKFVSE